MPDCWPGRGRPLGNLAGVELEQVVVAPAGRNPAEAGLLFATPGLFERLASWESAGARAAGLAVGGVLLSTSVPPPAAGSGAGPPLVWSLDELIARGEKLFFQETFNGNGRTCGTCHPAENNFTIDVPFIAALPANDPLFVAEGHPDLDSTLRLALPRPATIRCTNTAPIEVRKSS